MMFTDEYGTMLKALTHESWEVVDCIFKAHGKHQVTMGDSIFHTDKTQKCASPVLTDGYDSMSKQTLDYIF